MASERAMTVFDVYGRFAAGKKVTQEDHNATIARNVSRLREKHRLSFGIKVIPEEKRTVNSLFAAGAEMLSETGFFNPDLGRVMSITEDEIFEGLKRVPRKIRFGCGNDEAICERRHGNPHSKPVIQGGPAGSPVSEDVFVKVMRSYAQETAVDALANGIMATFRGGPVTKRMPSGISAAMAEARAANEAAAMAGRPGMDVSGASPISCGRNASARCGGTMMLIAGLCAHRNDLTMGTEEMNALAAGYANGGTVTMRYSPVFGGSFATTEEAAVCDVAATLASFVMFGSHMHTDAPVHVRWGSTTAFETLQIAAHTAAAVDANTDLFLAGQCHTAAGPCTEMCLLETAAQAVADTASGRELLSGPAAARGAAVDRATGMEARMMGEAAKAAAGMKVADANRAIGRILSFYGNEFPRAPAGRTFGECYDVSDVRPSAEYLEIYDNAVLKLKESGLDLKI